MQRPTLTLTIGVAIGCARRAAHVGLSLWGPRWTLCGKDERVLLESLY